MHYFLVDDTVEVRADKSKDGFAVFLKKQKLPKGKGKKILRICQKNFSPPRNFFFNVNLSQNFSPTQFYIEFVTQFFF